MGRRDHLRGLDLADLDFRHQLRISTEEDHLRAETVLNLYMSEPQRWVGYFLASQYSALGALAKITDFPDMLPLPTSLGVLNDAMKRLSIDLINSDILYLSPVSVPQQMDPLALDYLVLGSRLGVEVLRRKWVEGSGIGEIPVYFSRGTEEETIRQLWKDCCLSLTAVRPNSERAGKIMRDVKAGYALFADAATSLNWKTWGRA